MERKIKVAINVFDFLWAGGIDFIKYVIQGLLYQDKYEIYIISPKVNFKSKYYLKKVLKSILQLPAGLIRPKIYFNSVKDLYALPHNYIYKNINNDFGDLNIKIDFYNEYNLWEINQYLINNKIDVFLPILNSFHTNFAVPSIGYIFDFVYRYHSYLYSEEFCYSTDIKFANTLKLHKVMMVNSKAVANDIIKFFPYSKNKIYSLPFSPYFDEHAFHKAINFSNEILIKYGLENDIYFIVSNQFWLHKDHATAFKAIKLVNDELSKDGASIKLICTGKHEDLSGTDRHVQNLKLMIKDLGIDSKIIFTGFIPKLDQTTLLLNSISLIQPTTFEGGPGGGSVYQALALGVHCIVSDIPVNLEIDDEENITFFNVGNEHDLAVKILEQYHAKRKIKDIILLKNKSNARQRQLFDCLDKAITEALKKE